MPIWRRSASSPTGSSILCCTGSCPIASAARATQFLFVLGGPNGRRVKELRSIIWKGLPHPCRNVGLSGGGFRAECLFQEHFLFFGIVERTGPHLAHRHARAWCCCLLSTRGSTTAAGRPSSSEVIMSVGTVARPVESRGVYLRTIRYVCLAHIHALMLF